MNANSPKESMSQFLKRIHDHEVQRQRRMQRIGEAVKALRTGKK